MIIQSILSLGDDVYVRSVVRTGVEDGSVSGVITAWPQLYHDIPVAVHAPESFCHPSYTVENSRKFVGYSPRPAGARRQRVHYDPILREGRVTVLGAIERSAGLEVRDFSLSAHPSWGSGVNASRVAVFRYPSKREKFWACPSRDPAPGVISQLAEISMRMGYTVISVANNAPGEEEFLDVVRPCSHRFERGELGLEQLAGLILQSSFCVSPNGFFWPLVTALGKNLFAVSGGYIHPERVIEARMVSPNSVVRIAAPDSPCDCLRTHHDCDKTIRNLDEKFHDFLELL